MRADEVYPRCTECREHLAFDPLTQSFVHGKQFGRRDHYRHQREIQHRQHSPSEEPSSRNVSDDSGGPARSEDDSNGESSRSRSGITSMLDKMETEFRSRKNGLRLNTSLIFVAPPNPTDTTEPSLPEGGIGSYSDFNTGLYALDYSREVNRPLLEYLHWLHDLTLRLDSLPLSDTVRHRRKTLLDLIDGEISRLESFRSKEWKRQYDEQSRARAIHAKGKIHVIDTGWLAV